MTSSKKALVSTTIAIGAVSWVTHLCGGDWKIVALGMIAATSVICALFYFADGLVNR